MATPVRGQVRGRWPAPGTIHGGWTASDLESLPDDGLRYEIIDGTLLVHSPVLLVEIASPSSKRIDRTLKHETYARAGVPQYWIVDPGSKDRVPSVEVYDLAGGEYRRQVRVTGDESTAVSGPVPVVLTPAELIG